jgi:Domain of unknown function (DUF1843)
MPTSKRASQPKNRRTQSKQTTSAKTASKTGAVPPYGVPIREAIARGDPQEMRKMAVIARKHINEVQTALAALERNLKKLEAR